MLVDLESEWFKLYAKAMLEAEPEVARDYKKSALASIDQRLRLPDVPDAERQAMLAVVRCLSIVDENEPPKNS